MLTQDVRIFETLVHRDPHMARHQINKKAYHHSSSYCIRISRAGNEKNLIFLILKFLLNLLKS